MTNATIALTELAEKGADIDVLRQMVQFMAQRLMEIDVDGRCGAGYDEKSAERINSRNGYRDRTWDTCAEVGYTFAAVLPFKAMRPLAYPDGGFRPPGSALDRIGGSQILEHRVWIVGSRAGCKLRASLAPPPRPRSPATHDSARESTSARSR